MSWFNMADQVQQILNTVQAMQTQISALQAQGKQQMAAIDDLTAAVAAEQTALTTLGKNLTQLESDVTAAISAIQAANPNDPAIAAAVTQLQAASAQLGTLATGVQTSAGNLEAALPKTP